MQGVQCTRAQRCGGPKICPTLFLKSFLGEEGALLEYLHAGPLQPCYATGSLLIDLLKKMVLLFYRDVNRVTGTRDPEKLPKPGFQTIQKLPKNF